MRLKLLEVVLVALITSTTVMAVSMLGHAQQPSLFEVVIPATLLNAAASPPNSPAPQTLRQFLGELTVRANGAVCFTTDLTSSSTDVVLQLGLPGQASPCTMMGRR